MVTSNYKDLLCNRPLPISHRKALLVLHAKFASDGSILSIHTTTISSLRSIKMQKKESLKMLKASWKKVNKLILINVSTF